MLLYKCLTWSRLSYMRRKSRGHPGSIFACFFSTRSPLLQHVFRFRTCSSVVSPLPHFYRGFRYRDLLWASFSKRRYRVSPCYRCPPPSVGTPPTRSFLGLSREVVRLHVLAKPEKWRLTGAVCLLFISSAVTMAVPFSMGKIIDIIYTADKDAMKAKLEFVSKILIIIFVTGATANCCRVFLMNTAGYRITQRLRMTVFSSILKQDVAFFDKNKTGELVNRLSADTALVGNSLSMNISDGLRSLVSVVAGVSMMFYVSTELALLSLATLPPVAALSIVYGRYVRKITTSVQDALAHTTQLAEERISNVRTVRAFARESDEGFLYERSLDRVLSLMYRESVAKGLFFGGTGLSGNLIVLSVLYYGGLMMTESTITVGDLSAFLLYAAYVGLSFGGLSSAYSEVMKGLGASTRLWQIVDRIPTIPLSSGLIPKSDLVGNVVFDSVSFSYPSRPDILIFDKISLEIPAGRVTALVGASGSGKSTLAHLILRFYDPILGRVSIDGYDIRELNPSWIRTMVGVVSQEPVLFSCSIRENILYGIPDGKTNVTRDELVSVCEEANAWSFIQSFPDQLDTIVGEKGIMLSGGQKQRVAIARALLKNPRILLMDEATSALDAESEHQVQEALERILKGRTVLTIAHRLSTIKRADQIAVLANGKVAEVGSYDSLLRIPDGIFGKLIERQTIVANGR